MSSDPTREFDLVSPCIGVCQMDPVTELCRGCWRTIGEIASWSGLDRDGLGCGRLRLDRLCRRLPAARAAGGD